MCLSGQGKKSRALQISASRICDVFSGHKNHILAGTENKNR